MIWISVGYTYRDSIEMGCILKMLAFVSEGTGRVRKGKG